MCPFFARRLGAFALALVGLAGSATAAEIVRDAYGVPHVYGASVPDAFFGYGYAVAEDRLFQLEMRRRQATGQLAAVLGPTARSSASGAEVKLVELDVRARAAHDAADLRRQFNGLPTHEQALIRAYLDGLNLRLQEVLAEPGQLLPAAFRDVWGDGVAQRELRAWTLDDLLATATNALTSFSSFTTSQQNAALLAALKKKYPADHRKLFDTLLWLNDPYAPTTREDGLALPPAPPQPLPRTTEAPPGGSVVAVHVPLQEEGEVQVSTSMAVLVGKARTGGASIQLNGPQPGWSLPSYFYTVGLHAPGYDVVGHAPGGLLAITTGDNGHIAWGSTSAGGDHTTVFEERLSSDRRRYAFQGHMRDVRSETVTIAVKGRKPEQVTIDRTHRGPFVTPLNAPVVYSQQIAWKGHELTSVMAWQRATQARDWPTFHAEGQRMAMGYNWFYSDREGHIGWLFGGFFPADLSGRNGDPRLPAMGEQGDATARSYANELFAYDPPSGYIVNWNNKPARAYANRDLHTPRWAQGDRANILAELMRQRAQQATPIGVDDVRQIYQRATTTDVNFHHFAPMLRRIDAARAAALDRDTQRALGLLQQWDGARWPDPSGQVYASAAVPIFQAWLDAFVGLTVGTLLTREEFAGMPMYTGTLQLSHMKNSVNLAMGTKIALRGLQSRMGVRTDDVPPFDVLRGQDPQQLMLRALQDAVVRLKKSSPGPVESWRQPMVRQTFFPENFEAVPTAGQREPPSLSASANRGAMQRLAVGDAGGMRSEDANPPGVSAEPGSPHHTDQLTLYGEWGFKPLPLNAQKTGPGKVVNPPSRY